MAHSSQLDDSHAIAAPVTAAGVIRADSEALAPFRKKPGVWRGKPIAPNFLKHSDEQTVAALVTTLRMIEHRGWQDRDFSDWGVLSAPNFFGRVACARTLIDFLRDGPWGLSPHVIPHLSCHGLSGTISMALGIHGPNFGIGSGPNAVSQAFLVAGAMLADGRFPGLWVTFTGHADELFPGQAPPTCLAAVLAIEPAADNALGTIQAGGRTDDPTVPEFTLPDFCRALETGTCGRWALAGGGIVHLPSISGVLTATLEAPAKTETPKEAAA